MIIRVPYNRSRKDTDCGPLALKMVLKHFGQHYSFEKIAKEEKQIYTGLVWSCGIARAARKLGFNAKLISTSNFSHEEDDIEYYKKYADNKAMIVLKELAEEVSDISEERDMSLDELLSFVTQDSLPIVLVNWAVIAGRCGFSGHFLPVVGYDEENVYVHNPGLAMAQRYMPIKRDLFVKAWESKGTDKDTVVVFRERYDKFKNK